MRENSPKKNFIYNIIYQILTLIIPLIITPYLSRVIGSGGVGIYSYTYSIVHYFMLLTMMGVNNYGNRTIAKVREDNDKLSKTFWSIYLLQLIMGLTLTIIYISYVLIFDNEFKIIALIQSLFIISSMLDINWFFFGLEEFKKTITRNTFVKITNIVLIFLLVKTKSDVWKYTFIMAGMTCLSQLILWGFAKGKVELVKIKWQDIAKHIKPNLVLFIPVIAVSLYKIMDKTMLDMLSTEANVGWYYAVDKISKEFKIDKESTYISVFDFDSQPELNTFDNLNLVADYKNNPDVIGQVPECFKNYEELSKKSKNILLLLYSMHQTIRSSAIEKIRLLISSMTNLKVPQYCMGACMHIKLSTLLENDKFPIFVDDLTLGYRLSIKNATFSYLPSYNYTLIPNRVYDYMNSAVLIFKGVSTYLTEIKLAKGRNLWGRIKMFIVIMLIQTHLNLHYCYI